ncbi:Translation initiation factor IF-2, mitochondrial [Toxocara canis]|uniref:Translation initiation factor IF-2, mitochondrial n=1 Tax=Toxocara canis TaxID=6265 RepID=A0A0B2VYR8_TOXCA|nr:Translation initiation factor IF-2, mitochondrial [Toxocara canis]
MSCLLRSVRCALASTPSCSAVASLTPKNFTINAVLLARHSKRKRKFVEPVVVKNTKSSKKPVDIYNDMTVSEVAVAVGSTNDDVAELLLQIDSRNVDLLSEDRGHGSSPHTHRGIGADMLYEYVAKGEVAVAVGSTNDDVAELLLQIDSRNVDLLSEDRVLRTDLIAQVVSAFNLRPRLVARPNESKLAAKTDGTDDVFPLPPPSELDLHRRAPIITIMGHVDHGKTTLLDCLRHSRIVESEFGGITQHIGAFTVKEGEQQMTFLDTPGHAAFAGMRQRGANSTDIVVLVVAADDGVKEQTVQSINYAKEAGVPIIVAINKCDKPNADPRKAKRSLLQYGIVVEDFHGDVLSVEISALRGDNIAALKEAILLQAEDMNLRSTSKGPVEGVVIESTTVQGVGKVCTVIVQRGTLTKGCVLVAGTSWAKVRLMTDEFNRIVKEAGPSSPIRVAGWRDSLPSPGERIIQVDSEARAQRAVEYRISKKMEQKAELDWKAIEGDREAERKKYLENRQRLLDKGARYGSTLRRLVHKEHRLEKEVSDGKPCLKMMIHSDVDGTLEALLKVLETYTSQKVELQLVDFGVGPPCEKDIELAAGTGAIIYCFNTMIGAPIKRLADRLNVPVERFNVIYHLVDDLKSRLSACLPDEIEHKLVAEGRVLKEFLISDRGRKKKPIAGVRVIWGNFTKSNIYRFQRGNTVYYEGNVESMKCEAESVTSAKTNEEVGLALANKAIRFEEGDVVNVYEKIAVKQTIDWNPPGF